jgi:hypothetical protein
MGEQSKANGDFGEATVAKLLELIGWQPLVKNFDMRCLAPEDHQLGVRNREKHGIDFFYRYTTPLFEDTEELILISSKYENYPNNPVARFKSHLRDITDSLFCLKKGKQFNTTHVTSNYQKRYTGVIFWLDHLEPYGDLISQLTKYNFKNETRSEFEVVFLVDNNKAHFLEQSISHVRNMYKKSKVAFLYPDTGYNYTARGRVTHGSILPVQYINSSVLPFKVITLAKEEYLVLCVNEEFNENSLTGLLNLTHKLSEGWGQRIQILFPDYDSKEGTNIINRVKQSFQDQEFALKVTAGSYNPNFRNLV